MNMNIFHLALFLFAMKKTLISPKTASIIFDIQTATLRNFVRTGKIKKPILNAGRYFWSLDDLCTLEKQITQLKKQFSNYYKEKKCIPKRSS